MNTESAVYKPLNALMKAFPGALLAIVIAMAATLVSTLHGGPQLLYALVFGVAFHYLSSDPKAKPGIEFCSRHVLRLGVGLLGARITAAQIAGLGWTTASIVIVAVVSTLMIGYFVGRRLGLSRAQGVLTGGSVAICGASAALAISSILPRSKDSEQFTLMVVVTVTILSTVAMVSYPLLATALNLPPHLAGLFLGGSIHDVAQVVGAGYMIDTATGDYATIVKLFRVALLAVVVVVLSALFKAERARAEAAFADQTLQGPVLPEKQPLVPWFLWVFVAFVLLNSVGAVPIELGQFLGDVSRLCLVVAIAALGIKTSVQQLTKAGRTPFVLILVESLWIALFILAAIYGRGLVAPSLA